VATASGITLLTLPYPKVKGITDGHELLSEYTEMVFYVAIGLVAGILIEQQWDKCRKREALAEELAVKELLSSLGQMAAGLAREIKNPLGSIQGAAEMRSSRRCSIRSSPHATPARDLDCRSPTRSFVTTAGASPSKANKVAARK
jgi:signal transduction histidine kinase